MTLRESFEKGFKFVGALFTIIIAATALATTVCVMLWFIPTAVQSAIGIFVFITTMLSLIFYFVEKGWFDFL
jgi:hypothetical protein